MNSRSLLLASFCRRIYVVKPRTCIPADNVIRHNPVRPQVDLHVVRNCTMSATDPRIQKAVDLIELCPDFPKPGILFKNLFPVLRNPQVFKGLIEVIVEDIRKKCPGVEVIVGLDSRGFLFGPMVAQALDVAFIPVRKAGKLPGKTFKAEYELEYGKDVFEVQANSIKEGEKVVIIDDLLATGGTMRASCDLMEATKAEVLGCVVVIELLDLKGKEKLKYPLLSYIN